MAEQQKVTAYQERVYTALQQIPEGRVTTYGAMSKALDSSPRAVGNALRVNPFAPEIPCHRCIASTGVRLNFEGACEIALTQAVRGRLQGRVATGAKRAESGVEA